MRRLLLLRHARAAPAVGGDDFGRALTTEGEEDASRVGDLMAREALQTDYALCSSARRALETATIVLGRWPNAPRPTLDSRLYDATWRLVLALARDLPEAAASALIVGHNPGIGDLASWLTGEGDRAERLRMAAKFPPCGLVVLDFDAADWPNVSARSGRLERFVTPSDLASE
jgi:phosphohistidine phosphatase